MEKGFEYPRDFKGIFIPKEVWLDDKLSAIDKFILAEINSLDVEEKGGCYASNEYLAEFCQCSVSKVSASISKLIKLRYVKIDKFDGRKRFLRVCLTKFSSLYDKKSESPSQKIEQRHTYSNTDRNIENNNMDVCSFSGKKSAHPTQLDSFLEKAFADELVEPDEAEARISDLKEIITYFMAKYMQEFRKTHRKLTEPAVKKIVENYLFPDDDEYGTMNDMYTLDDYQQIIDLYFMTKYGDGTEKSLSHFMSGLIRRNLKVKLID